MLLSAPGPTNATAVIVLETLRSSTLGIRRLAGLVVRGHVFSPNTNSHPMRHSSPAPEATVVAATQGRDPRLARLAPLWIWNEVDVSEPEPAKVGNTIR